jgi:deoxycytidylate deaminase
MSVPNIENPELFIGLICPVGSDATELSSVIIDELKEFDYDCEIVKLSKILFSTKRFEKRLRSIGTVEPRRIEELMKCGDELRKVCKTGEILAALGTAEVQELRDQRKREGKNARVAFIFNSLKHHDEVTALRQIYGKQSLMISLYAPKGERLKRLAKRIGDSRNDPNSEAHVPLAQSLINNDALSQDKKYGQNVRSAFPMADVFISMGIREEIKKSMRRILDKWFCSPYVTPTKDEHGMFHAKAAALRSSDLARQVGAIIQSDDGEILASGCNEVPRVNGGLIWEGDKVDERDFRLGYDTTTIKCRELVGEVVQCLNQMELLNGDIAPDKIIGKIFDDDQAHPSIANSGIMNIIEFGRIVHAEMAALMDAAKRGISTAGMTLVCTTYPCHMCARHIIAAGIKRVVFIEPYPKSLAKNLYDKSIGHDDDSPESESVRFQSFVGIGPERYFDLFSMGSKKKKGKDGKLIKWIKAISSPRFEIIYNSIAAQETAALNFARGAMNKADAENSQRRRSASTSKAPIPKRSKSHPRPDRRNPQIVRKR